VREKRIFRKVNLIMVSANWARNHVLQTLKKLLGCLLMAVGGFGGVA